MPQMLWHCKGHLARLDFNHSCLDLSNSLPFETAIRFATMHRNNGTESAHVYWMVPHMGRAWRRGRSTGFWHACVDMPGVAHRASRTEEAAAPGSNACQSRQRELSVALMCGMKVLCCRQSLLPACCNVANGTGDDCAWTHQPLCPQHLRSVLMGIDFQSPS